FSETSPARSHAHNITANGDRSADAGAENRGRKEGAGELCTVREGQARPRTPERGDPSWITGIITPP
ncbi:MAG: hypothetical protein WBI00_04045, partial [Thermoanaerobaculia bacterium]